MDSAEQQETYKNRIAFGSKQHLLQSVKQELLIVFRMLYHQQSLIHETLLLTTRPRPPWSNHYRSDIGIYAITFV